MIGTGDPADARLLVALQQGLPLDRRPFARIGTDLGLSEETVLGRVRALFEAGVARRFGAVFDSRSLGYESTLCAAEVPAHELGSAAARIAPHPGITHCYEREGHPNLWFTLTAPAAQLSRERERVSAALGSYTVLNLPARRNFKIEAVFGRDVEDRPARRPPRAVVAAPPLSDHERQVVRRLQANIAVSEDPFGQLAGELGRDPAELLDLLRRWQQSGVVRRIGLILRHRRLGFAANSMCVWSVAGDRIEAAGCVAARSPYVSHCYERPASPAFPFNLYAMLHAKTREELRRAFEDVSKQVGVAGGRMLWSVREFKKSSPLFFGEAPPE